MKLFKVHKDIEIDKRFGNVRITTINYSKPIENSESGNTTQKLAAGMIMIARIALVVGKVEAMRENVMIVGACLIKMEILMFLFGNVCCLSG